MGRPLPFQSRVGKGRNTVAMQSAGKTARIPSVVLHSIEQCADHLADYIRHCGHESDPLIVQAQINLMQERLDRSQE